MGKTKEERRRKKCVPSVSGSDLDGFVGSRVGECGLEMLGRKKKKTEIKRNIKRHRIESGGQPSDY